MLYSYLAQVRAVHDGDSVTVDIDLGFGTWLKNVRLRLDGINAPELSTPAGKLAQQFLANTILASTVNIRTRKTSGNNPNDAQEKYGRYLATIFTLPPADINVNELLVTNGYAQHVAYGVEHL